MASTINASNTGFGGIVQTGDSSGTLALQAAGTTVATVSSTGLAVTGSVTTNGVIGSPYTMKNRIINGGMQVWQRGTSFSNPANITYTADRWFSYFGTTNRTVSQQAGFSGFQYCTRLQRTNGVTDTSASGIGQVIEANNLYALQGQTVTLSFYARAGSNFSSSGSNLAVLVNSGTTADQGASTWYSPGWAGATTPYNSSVTITTTATQYSVTFTVPANCLELFIGFQYSATGTAGANDYFEITGVQLEVGSSATSFEWRPYGMELSLCQRYYWRTNASAVYTPFGNGWNVSTTAGQAIVKHPVTMRTGPTVIDSSTLGSVVLGSSNTAITSVAIGNTGTDMVTISYSGTGMTTGFTTICANASTSAYLGFGAEL